MSLQRILFARRRFDTWLLAAAFAATAVMNPAGKVSFVLLAASGFYLALARHRVRWLAPPTFTAALTAYCVWSAGLSLIRGEPIAGNRLLSYTAVETAVLFLPLGLALVRRPIEAMILGARIGVLLLLVASVVEYALTGGRVGLGGNEAILAFVATVIGIAARLRSGVRPPRFLPDGRWWPYIALVPVALTQTRALFFTFLVLALVDAADILLSRRRHGARPRKRWAIAAAAVAIAVAAAVIGPIVALRLEGALAELASFNATGEGLGSVNVRMVMWIAGLEVLVQHPLIGVGATHRMAEVGAAAGANEYIVVYYNHLHNILLDEALSSGLIGLALLLAVFAVFAFSVLRGPADQRLKQTSLAFLFLVFSFGLFHGVLLNEWMIVVVFGFMSVVLTGLRREERAMRIRNFRE